MRISKKRLASENSLRNEVLVRVILIAQFLAGALAAVIFQVGLDPRYAGLIAGSGFIAVGVYALWAVWKKRLGAGLWPKLVGILALGHVVGIAIPMLAFRIQHWSEPFSKVAVWGLEGPTFHALSTRYYMVWFAVTLVAAWQERKSRPTS